MQLYKHLWRWGWPILRAVLMGGHKDCSMHCRKRSEVAWAGILLRNTVRRTHIKVLYGPVGPYRVGKRLTTHAARCVQTKKRPGETKMGLNSASSLEKNSLASSVRDRRGPQSFLTSLHHAFDLAYSLWASGRPSGPPSGSNGPPLRYTVKAFLIVIPDCEGTTTAAGREMLWSRK